MDVIEINSAGDRYTLLPDSASAAFGYVNIEGRSIPLPGQYRLSEDAWINSATGHRLPHVPS